MAVSPTYRDYVRQRLGTAGPVRLKAMFGGYGVYSEEWFYALVSGDQLYFKADDFNRSDYLERACRQFMNMPYFAVPPDVLEDDALLHEWVEKAIDAARRARRKKTAPANGLR